MDCWVLGCGPSLSKAVACIPPGAFSIGTNNSYKARWSPVWAGTDLRALRRDYDETPDTDPETGAPWRPLVYLTAVDPQKVSVTAKPGRPLIHIPLAERISLRKAGVFAFWAALKLFGASRVNLIGFDMEGDCRHFDRPEVHLSEQTYFSQRFQMVKLQRMFPQVNARIWIDGSFYPVGDLPTTGMELIPKDFEEMDVTQGMALPQHFWKDLPPDWAERRKAWLEEQKVKSGS